MCLSYTAADPAYIEELAGRNIAYGSSNAAPASETFKQCKETRQWQLVRPDGRSNRTWYAKCSDVYKGGK